MPETYQTSPTSLSIAEIAETSSDDDGTTAADAAADANNVDVELANGAALGVEDSATTTERLVIEG